MYDRKQIMNAAWDEFRRVYSYPATSFNSIGRHCLASCIRRAWFKAKEKQALEGTSRTDREDRIVHLQDCIEGLKDRPFSVNIAEVAKPMRREIAALRLSLAL